jgi:hypothetical protein
VQTPLPMKKHRSSAPEKEVERWSLPQASETFTKALLAHRGTRTGEAVVPELLPRVMRTFDSSVKNNGAN